MGYLSEHAKRPPNFRDLCLHFRVRGSERKQLKDLLLELRREGKIVQLRNRRFQIVESGRSIVGRLQLHDKGFGFVIPEDGSEDIYVSPHNLKGAFTKDRVEVHVSRGADEGRVKQILERGLERVTGIVREMPDQTWAIEPIGSESIPWVFLSSPDPSQFESHEQAVGVAEINWKDSNERQLVGTLVSVLGDLQDPHIDTPLVSHRHNLPLDFPSPVVKEAQDIRERSESPGVQERLDLRNLPFVTIDGAEARDFDDAIAFEAPHTLWVAIADVATYVLPSSILDEEAASRGNSFYFPDRALPMLPSPLSSDLCSLLPHEDRLVLAAKISLGPERQVKGREFFRAVISSKARLTYVQVAEILEKKPDSKQDQMLHDMADVAKTLFSQRMKNGGIDFDLPEANIQLDGEGETHDIGRRERTWAHRLVEEFMLLANQEVARFLSKRGFPLPYRVHDRPVKEKLKDYLSLLQNYGYQVQSKGKDESTLINHLLRRLEKDPRARVFQSFLLRSMSQAHYSPKNIGHFGLGFDHYAHFTSPIRRYADLLVHRLLHACLDEKSTPKHFFPRPYQSLQNICVHISEQERLGVTAEREILKIKGIRYLNERFGETFSGTIVGMVSKGLFVELEDQAIEGFVHVSHMPGDRYRFDEKSMTMRGGRWGKSWRLGDRVQVRVVDASLERIRVDLALIP